jgi:hypothetical protein
MSIAATDCKQKVEKSPPQNRMALEETGRPAGTFQRESSSMSYNKKLDWSCDAEENLPTQSAPAGENTRLSSPDEISRRPNRPGSPPGQRAPLSDRQFRTLNCHRAAGFVTRNRCGC